MNNHGDGVSCRGTGSAFQMQDCLVQGNRASGVRLAGNCKGHITKCRFVRNGEILTQDAESSCSPCTGNVAIVSAEQKPLSGFRIENENKPNAVFQSLD